MVFNLKQQKLGPSFTLNSKYVSASAGSGKTRALTNRVLLLLLAGYTPKQILCLTFTNAAAFEIKQRIISRLKSWMIATTMELTEELSSLIGAEIVDESLLEKARSLYIEILNQLHELRVTTLHSLCSDILKRSSDSSSLGADFQIIDKVWQDKLFYNAFKAVMDDPELGIVVKESMRELSNYYEYSTITNMVKMVFAKKISLVAILDQYETFEDFIKSEANLRPKSIKTYEELMASIGLKNTVLNYLKQGLELANQDYEKLSLMVTWLESENKSELLSQYYNLFFTLNDKPRARVLSKATITKIPELSEFIEEQRELLMELKESINTDKLININRAFAIIVNCVLLEYERLKKQKNLAEYNDLIIEALRILKSNVSSVLYNLDINLKHVLVDEAQDLSDAQWELIKVITNEFFAGEGVNEGNRSVFIVGDLKQSIYGFQGAKPEIFADIRHYYQQLCSSVGQKFEVAELNTSYRSAPQVLEAVDKVFTSFSSIGIVKHKAFKSHTGLVKVWPKLTLEAVEKRNTAWSLPSIEDHEEQDIKQKLAIQIAEEIGTWLKQGKKLNSEDRYVEPSDIMILFRKRGPLQENVITELKKRGLSVSDSDRIVLTDNLIVQDLLALAKFTLNPKDELNLAGLLKSPLCNLSEEGLFKVAFGRETNLWEHIQNNHTELFQKLDNYLKASQKYTIHEFYLYVLYELGAYREFIKRFGNKTYNVIDTFLEQVVKYQELSKRSGFIDWVEKSNLEIQNNNATKRNEIRVMTVHNAKGLEAPIVILADASDSDSLPRDIILWNKDCFYINTPASLDNRVLKSIKERHIEALEAENLRLLYVAMTRACDELHICGFETKKGTLTNWYDLIAESGAN